jgi:hypothetical protein
MVKSMAMIDTTISTSMRVKPLFARMVTGVVPGLVGEFSGEIAGVWLG